MERAASELSRAISSHFSMHPARLACLLGMIWGLIGGKRVQLWALAEQFGGQAKPASRVRRIERFLAKQALAWEGVARCIVALVAVPGKWTLVMDRSNWQFGKRERNYLVLALVYEGNAIPLLVKDLEQAGNSDTAARIALMKRFLAIFGHDKVFCLLGDREFIGEDWFKWLKENNIPPCIRTRNNTLVRHRNGGKVQVHTLLRSLAVGQYRTWNEKLYGQNLRMVGLKISGGEYVVLLADPALNVDLLPLYKIRWTIECLFKNAKSSGFLWETTHLIHADRAEKLVAVLALATTLAIKEGAAAHAIKPIPFRKTVGTLLHSLFTHGLRRLAAAFRNIQNPINSLLLYDSFESVG